MICFNEKMKVNDSAHSGMPLQNSEAERKKSLWFRSVPEILCTWWEALACRWITPSGWNFGWQMRSTAPFWRKLWPRRSADWQSRLHWADIPAVYLLVLFSHLFDRWICHNFLLIFPVNSLKILHRNDFFGTIITTNLTPDPVRRADVFCKKGGKYSC